MTSTKRKADLDGTIIDPTTFLMIRLLSGHSYLAHICAEPPRDRHDIARVSLGPGVVSAASGQFRAVRSGRIVCIAYIVEGELVVSEPWISGLMVREGEIARVGAITSNKCK